MALTGPRNWPILSVSGEELILSFWVKFVLISWFWKEKKKRIAQLIVATPIARREGIIKILHLNFSILDVVSFTGCFYAHNSIQILFSF